MGRKRNNQASTPKSAFTQVVPKPKINPSITELTTLRGLWQNGLATTEEIKNHVDTLWPHKSTHNGKPLWDILTKVQDEIDAKLAKEEQRILEKQNSRYGHSDSDSDEEDFTEYEYTTAFPQSVDCLMFYDLKDDKILGPLSLVTLPKATVKYLDKNSPKGHKRVAKDMATYEEYKKSGHIFYWYAK